MTSRTRPMPQPISDIVARNVRKLREANGWSTTDLCHELYLHKYPMSAATIGNIERRQVGKGATNPRVVTVDELCAFAEAFGIAPQKLLHPIE